MDFMFWIWLVVIVLTAVVEFATMEIVSIWFTFGAIIPFILSGTRAVSWWVQIVIFVLVSSLLIISLRSLTKKFLLRNTNEKTNTDAYVGQKFKMLERTDFETVGRVKINDVVWSAVAENRETIEKEEIVEVVKISGNKLVVKRADLNGKEPEKKSEKNKRSRKANADVQQASEGEEVVEENVKSQKNDEKTEKKSEKTAKNDKKDDLNEN